MNSLQSKEDRVFPLYTRLQKGDVIHKSEETQRFGVTEKSIQRDLDMVRDFLASEYTGQPVVYDKRLCGYRLDTQTVKLSNSGILSAVKDLSIPRQYCF